MRYIKRFIVIFLITWISNYAYEIELSENVSITDIKQGSDLVKVMDLGSIEITEPSSIKEIALSVGGLLDDQGSVAIELYPFALFSEQDSFCSGFFKFGFASTVVNDYSKKYGFSLSLVYDRGDPRFSKTLKERIEEDLKEKALKYESDYLSTYIEQIENIYDSYLEHVVISDSLISDPWNQINQDLTTFYLNVSSFIDYQIFDYYLLNALSNNLVSSNRLLTYEENLEGTNLYNNVSIYQMAEALTVLEATNYVDILQNAIEKIILYSVVTYYENTEFNQTDFSSKVIKEFMKEYAIWKADLNVGVVPSIISNNIKTFGAVTEWFINSSVSLDLIGNNAKYDFKHNIYAEAGSLLLTNGDFGFIGIGYSLQTEVFKVSPSFTWIRQFGNTNYNNIKVNIPFAFTGSVADFDMEGIELSIGIESDRITKETYFFWNTTLGFGLRGKNKISSNSEEVNDEADDLEDPQTTEGE